MHTRGFHGPTGHGLHRNPTGFGKKKGHYPTGFDWQNQIDPVIDQKLRKYGSFGTKYKVFMVTLTYDGGSVRICERTRHFGYEITITMDVVDWIFETVKEVQQKEERQRVSFKDHFEILLAAALRNNKLKSVIIREEEKAKGWSELLRCLNRTMKRDQTSKEEKNVGGISNQRSSNVVKDSRKPAAKHSYQKETSLIKVAAWRKGDIEWKDLYLAINPSFKPKNPYPEKRFNQPKYYEYMRSKSQIRKWKLAIILNRDNNHVSWSVIFYNLSRELGRKLVVSQMFDDRCVVWCKDEMGRDDLIKIQEMNVAGAQTAVSFSQWSWELQKKNTKVECRDSWIGVQGLPLNLWHMKTFRKIGDSFGGLLDVDKKTAEASMLSHLRLQLMGDEYYFVPESIVLEHEDMKFDLKLFKLNDVSYRFHGYFNTCWHQDFDHDKMYTEGEDSKEAEDKKEEEDEDKEEDIHGKHYLKGVGMPTSPELVENQP
ncbi:hypothetical protein G4B88_007887 [Cannabis sativa]|uniref:DUF4283 domain-containing protein n=1 Tax=Cannabis sativa TaxID=3483 RepID=A0A7J6EJL5_CANSA|nr:hypothetical protein G4B88_007887 [Cannabis sativa]